MRYALTAIVRFITALGLAFLLLNVIIVPHLIAEGPQVGIWYFSSRLVSFWSPLLITAYIVAVLRVHLYLLKRQKPFGAQSAVFLLGSLLLFLLLYISPSIRLALPPPGGSHRLAASGTIFSASRNFLWIGNTEGFNLHPILIMRYNPKTNLQFSVSPEGVYNPERNTIRILSTGEDIPLHDRITKNYPPMVNHIWESIESYTRMITPRNLHDLRSLLLISSFVLLLCFLYPILRTTSWLLLNYSLAVLMPVLIIVSIEILKELEILQLDSYVPAILNLSIAFLCFVWQMLLRTSYKR